MDLETLIFDGFCFFLAGFDSQHFIQEKAKIVNEGGVVLDEYGPRCTHVVVHKLVLDDIVCNTARKDGKMLVTSLWLTHSLEFGVPADAENIIYKPLRSLTGIPGADKFKISITGYEGPDRDEIKTMVYLMGAELSKQLRADETTHLVCYKFEGDKYRLAKLRPYTKIVNHQWLKDCLLNWKILPEEPYSTKSGYEISIMDDQVEDSEDDIRDDIGRNQSWITNLQHEMGDAPNNFMVASKLPISSRQEGISSSSIINEALSKSDLLSESGNISELYKQHTQRQKDHTHVVAYSETAKEQNSPPPPANQCVSGAPSTSGNRKNSAALNVELFDSSKNSRKTLKKSNIPSHVREDLGSTEKSNSDNPSSSKTSSRSRSSLQPARKFGTSDIDDVPTFKSPTGNEETTWAVGVSDVERNKSVAHKHIPLNSKGSSVSLNSAEKLNSLDETLEKGAAEKVIVDLQTSDKKSGLIDNNSLGALLPQKRTADGSNVSHDTLKSHKLTTSASKRIDAAEPITPVSNPFKKRENGELSSGNRIGQDNDKVSSGRPSPNVFFAKSIAKSVDPSRSSAAELLQGSRAMNVDVLVTPNRNSGLSTSSGMKVKMGETENTCQHGAASSGTNDIEAVEAGSPKLNSGDEIGSSGSKLPRRKMVARRTLGSKPKLSKKCADAQRCSVSTNYSGDDAAIHQTDQANREDIARLDEVPVVSVVHEPIRLGSKANLKSGTDMTCSQKLLDEETDAPPELGVNNQKHLKAKGSFDVKHQVSDSASDKTFGQETYETIKKNKKVVAQKKEKAVKAKKKTEDEDLKNADEGEGGKISNEVKDQVVDAAAKKRRGTLILNKPTSSVEVENEIENELVGNKDAEATQEDELISDQHVNGSVKDSGKVELKNKRAGTQVLKKAKGAVQNQNDNVSVYQDADGANHGEKCSTELGATSDIRQGDTEMKCNSDPSVENDQGVSKVLKRTGKLAGKKRCGTLLLRKSNISDEANKGNVPVSDGGQHPAQMDGASGISDRSMEVEDNVRILGENQGTRKGGNHAGNLAGKKMHGNPVLNKNETRFDEKENEPVVDDDGDKCEAGISTGNQASKSNLTGITAREGNSEVKSTRKQDLELVKKQSACFIVSGHRLQRKEFQQLIKRLKGKVCRDSHQWSYQATHFIVPDPIRRTEKFFAAAASGSWILKTNYLTASSQAGKLLPEEPYEWHRNGLTEDGAISFEAPRKWRLLRERTGHGAFYGMRIIIYGECIAPPLDTLKRAVKAGDGTILATSPPYTRFLQSGVDFAIVSPGMPRVDMWVQEFLRHQIPCVLADFLVEYVCKPGYSLDRHVQYSTHEWAAKSFSKLLSLSEEVVIADFPSEGEATSDNEVSEDLECQVCGSTDRGEVMLICGDDRGSKGCGIGTHIDCCDPPLEDIPEEDWFCPKCIDSSDDFPGLSNI